MSSILLDTVLFLVFFYGLSSNPTTSLLANGPSLLDSISIGCVLALTALMIFVWQTITAPEVPLESTHQAMLAHKFHAQQLAKHLSAAKVEAAMHRIAIEEQDEVIARLTCDVSEKDAPNEEDLRALHDTRQQLLVERGLLARRTAQIDRLAGTLSALHADYDNLSAKRDADVSALNGKLARARSSLSNVEADLTAAKELLVARNAKISALEAVLAELENAKANVLAEHEALQTTHTAVLARHADDLVALNADLDDTTLRLTTAQQQLDQEMTNNGALLTQIGSVRCAVDGARLQLLNKEAEIFDLTATVDEAKARARKAEERRARGFMAAQAAREALEAKIAFTENASKVAEAALAATKVKLAHRKCENRAFADEQTAVMERMMKKFRADTLDKERAIREKAEAEAEVDALKAEIETTKDTAAAEKSHVESLFDALRAQLDAKADEHNALTGERANIEAMISAAAPVANGSLAARLQSFLSKNASAGSASDLDELAWPADDHRPLLTLSRIVAAKQRQLDAGQNEQLQLQVEAYQFSRRLDQYTEDDVLAKNWIIRTALDVARAERERRAAELEQLKQSVTGTPSNGEEEAAAAPVRSPT